MSISLNKDFSATILKMQTIKEKVDISGFIKIKKL